MKKIVSFVLAVLLMCCSFAVTASAEDTPTQESSTPTTVTEPSATEKPTDPSSQPTDPSSQPTDPSTQPTQTTTEPTQASTACTHSYGDWDGDESSHWKDCTKCGHRESAGHSWAAETITVEPTCKDPGGECKICTVCEGVLVTKIIPQTSNHTYDNACDTTCNVCGAERTTEHTFGTGWYYSYKGHWHACTVCGAEDEVKSHYPGPAATEEKDQICLTCGYIMTKKLEHKHDMSRQWSSDDSGHWYECTKCGEEADFAVHEFEDACDPDCNICGYVSNAAHTYDGWQQDEDGHWQICTSCGTETTREPHVLNEEKTLCTVCALQLAEVHEHEFSTDWRTDEAGHWKECECGEQAEAGEHLWDEGDEEDGMTTYTCSVCRIQRQEETPGSGLPWWIFLLTGVLVLALAATVICLIMSGKKGAYSR